ncbi:flagellar hook-basal body protein [Paenibacillus sediminis]|uniref:Flagellar basal-body rod protein FlgG n=1 Tax=Paenibacillus sediminis TaxID=664909 RepID=A0ABS4H2C4_9BACL|nr:flagellar hook-basal body protein [Paenibacillus sediminis]MBP1936689.1 flagellar basal-body rod protein FlgG [Paenibacillus sediminis]
MLRGLYTAAAGMMTQQRIHDTVTQNIANINTPGYKEVNSVSRSFPEVLIGLVNGDNGQSNAQIGKLNTGVFAEESLPSFVEGTITNTDKASDFAIISNINVVKNGQNIPFDASGKYVDAQGNITYQPQAFFTVQDDQGQIRYTRDGSFHLDSQGQLVTSAGYLVLDTNNKPIVPNAPIDQLTVDGQGQFFDGQGNPTGQQMLISVVNNPNFLIREGNGVYSVNNPSQAGVQALQPGQEAEVRQRSLESSNVDPAQSMTDLMTALRAYEANSKVVQYYDKSLDKAVNELGRV